MLGRGEGARGHSMDLGEVGRSGEVGMRGESGCGRVEAETRETARR